MQVSQDHETFETPDVELAEGPLGDNAQVSGGVSYFIDVMCELFDKSSVDSPFEMNSTTVQAKDESNEAFVTGAIDAAAAHQRFKGKKLEAGSVGACRWPFLQYIITLSDFSDSVGKAGASRGYLALSEYEIVRLILIYHVQS